MLNSYGDPDAILFCFGIQRGDWTQNIEFWEEKWNRKWESDGRFNVTTYNYGNDRKIKVVSIEVSGKKIYLAFRKCDEFRYLFKFIVFRSIFQKLRKKKIYLPLPNCCCCHVPSPVLIKKTLYSKRNLSIKWIKMVQT